MLIGSDKGGVGKSLIAQIVIAAYDSAYEEARRLDATRGPARLSVVEIDNQRRLGSIYGDRVSLGLNAGPDIAETLRNPTAWETYFNKVYDVWASGPSLTDLGANVTTALLDWARYNELSTFAREDRINFRFVAVATPDDQSLRSALMALHQAIVALGRNTELFLVLNDTSGHSGYSFYQKTENWLRLHELTNTGGMKLIRIPYCRSYLLEWGRSRGYTIKDMVQNGAEMVKKLGEDSGYDRLTTRIHLKRFTDWTLEIQGQMAPLFTRAKSQAPSRAA